MCGCCNSLAKATGFQDKGALFGTTSAMIAICAIAHMTIGVLALYSVIPTSTALYTQMGLFAGSACLITATLAQSKKIKTIAQKIALAISILAILSVPVLFGGLGANGIIPPYSMLLASTVIGTSLVLITPFFGTSVIAKDCKDD